MTIVIAVLLWLALGLVQTMRFRVETGLSDYELTRRANAHDSSAQDALRYAREVPLMEALRVLIMTLLGVLFVTLLVTSFGVFNGVLLGAAGLLFSPLLQRVRSFCQLADWTARTVKPYASRTAHALRPLLRWLRDRDLANADTQVYSTDELIDILERSPGILTSDQMTQLQASIAFGTKTVADVMTPRSMIDTADVKDTVGPLVLDDLHRTGHSRFPVTEGDVDHVVGMLYLHDLIDLKSGHKTVKSAMSPKVYYIHEGKDLSHALHAFLRTHHHLFIVVNDYRETVGLLSLEDVLETLLGKKIVDEFDQFDDLRAVAESNPRKNNVPKGKTDL